MIPILIVKAASVALFVQRYRFGRRLERLWLAELSIDCNTSQTIELDPLQPISDGSNSSVFSHKTFVSLSWHRLARTISHAEKRSDASRARVIASTSSLALSSQTSFPVLAPINNVLQALALSGFSDFRPVQIFTRFGVIDNICHRARTDLALASC